MLWQARPIFMGPVLGTILAFTACLGVFALVMACIAIFFALSGLYLVAWPVWMTHFSASCDQPLESWLGLYLMYTHILPLIIRIAFNRWAQRNPWDRMPFHLQMLSALVPVLPFFWAMFGRTLATRSTTCAESSPWLHWFVGWFAWSAMVLHGFHSAWVCVSVGGVGIRLWMIRRGPHSTRWMARQGFLRNMHAARPNIIEEMEAVPYEQGLFADPSDPGDSRPPGECCICLEAYDDTRQIRRTQCGHFMHHECLDIWLQMSSTCPSCRSDLETFQRSEGNG